MKNILIIGGTGFLGSALSRRLASAEFIAPPPSQPLLAAPHGGACVGLGRPSANFIAPPRSQPLLAAPHGGACVGLGRPSANFFITLPTRRRERAKHLTVLPTVRVIEADVHDEATLTRLMAGQDAVISLVGILKGNFQRTHVELPGKIARAAASAGIARLLHVSALAAAADAPSNYLRSKAAGEAAVKAAFPAATIFQPSVIFGQGDAFLTLFADLLKLAPLVPLACPDARFQPIWIEDVVAALVASLADTTSHGQTYPLCGPRVYSLRELVAYTGKISGHPRPIIGLPQSLSYLQAWAMEFVPGGPMTRDNVRSMSVPNVCAAGCTLPFGLKATALEAVAPGYLGPR